MNKNLLIAFAGALLIAILVAMLMSTLLGGTKKKQPRVAEVKRIEILVAAKPIAIGQYLLDDNVKWKPWPEEAIFPGAIIRKGNQKTSEAKEGRVVRAFVIDEPIVSSAVISGEGSFTAARLEPGMRAVSIKANATTAAGGLVRPGDYVDVIMVYKGNVEVDSADEATKKYLEMISGMNIDKTGAQTILQNVRVLAVDQREKPASSDDKSGASGKLKTVTLEVDTRGAEKLAAGVKAGTLHLSLRSLGDTSRFDEKRPATTDARMILIDDEVLEQANKSLGGGANGGGVRIYSGGVPAQ
ncbi:Flp pilus assembly protein CpaB [Micavibrio aeruginosavorus]|uniref:Flp pilus assembly protein CpaB n=1 Tax=Micavibrio aeruginosavorus (strain ARL-13) TaxID=856793 RepID=G2KLN9_MICAA|nr:Flp pilus assembly protein CpaB [Micavibrio aeruginosavorus]AEP08869.1 flp pilus assembly protein CpaB [Micavibrio aeruginosavorus ARL-13]